MWKALLAITATLIIAGCDDSTPSNPTHTATAASQKMRVAYTYQPQSTLIHVAAAQRYFAEEGLDVQLLQHTHGKAALQSVLDGQADIATVAETPVMFSVLSGARIFVLANIESSTLNNAIVANMDAGIKTAEDLNGKRIGYTAGTTSEFFLDSMLTTKGLGKGDIRAVALKPDEMQQAMLSRQVDAVSTWNYPLTQIKHRLGTSGVVFYDRQIYTETFNIVAKQDFVDQHAEAVKRFLRALIKAEEFVEKYPVDAQNIVAAAAKIDIQLVREVWDASNYKVVLDQTLLLTLEDETRWALKNRLTEQSDMPDYASYVYLDGLLAVKPDAVFIHK
ncbi:MAG: NrtA/SsuA/CpmA family ABC transporter substrate-binding protein [Proteobacteria bacterium]|nr:NrtA/SsuA/CpmA family ABC transporter substrate-binding protein [Pseudomonadota bacterium]